MEKIGEVPSGLGRRLARTQLDVDDGKSCPHEKRKTHLSQRNYIDHVLLLPSNLTAQTQGNVVCANA